LIVETLIEEAMRLAEQMQLEGGVSGDGGPAVSVG
jgi:hypothetical protein